MRLKAAYELADADDDQDDADDTDDAVAISMPWPQIGVDAAAPQTAKQEQEKGGQGRIPVRRGGLLRRGRLEEAEAIPPAPFGVAANLLNEKRKGGDRIGFGGRSDRPSASAGLLGEQRDRRSMQLGMRQTVLA